MHKSFAVESQNTPGFIAQQVNSFFILPREVKTVGGTWMGFGIVGTKTEHPIFGTKTILDIGGLRRGELDPTLERMNAAETIGYIGFSTTDRAPWEEGAQIKPASNMFRAARLIVTPNDGTTHVQFEIDDPNLMEMFKGLARVIAPKPSQDTNATNGQAKRVRVPKGKRLQIWKTTWREVRARWETDPDETRICQWLKDYRPKLECSPELLRDIVAAGEAGLLGET